MRMKRILSAVLTLAMVCAMALPMSAAKSSFTDVSDANTAIHADVLRLMGVVSGTGGNQFSPGKQLTRAEFSAMAVKFMGLEDQVVLHATRTIFSDVTATHWARGYVNLAASTALGKEGKDRLISGLGDGRFAPDDKITFAQAVTILLRILGYTDQQAGSVWPQGYLNLAASLKLTEGLTLGAAAPLTRAQAARLFVQALSAKDATGAPYYKARATTNGGTVTENVILLATNVTANGGEGGAIRTSKGTYFPAVEGVDPVALQGRRGVLLLDSAGDMITFLPDRSVSITVTLSGNAQATYLTATGGTRYTISPSTPAFTSNTEKEDSTYAQVWVDLKSGSQITLFLDDGKVIGVFYGSSTTTTTDGAVVVTKSSVSAADFYSLTGGSSAFTVEKNKQTISLSDIKMNDVVTYDSMSNKLIVSDVRLSCVYESASPNATTPTQITALGHDFPVVENMLDYSDSVRIGEIVSLLLTADGQVAAIKKSGQSMRSTAIGLAGSSSVEFYLSNGATITLKSERPLPSNVQGKLVTVASSTAREISASRVMSSSAPGAFDVQRMTLGSYVVTAGVRIFEQVGNGAMATLSLSKLGTQSIAAGDIAAYHLNSSGQVDFIVLDGVTGDAYTYGRLVEEKTAAPGFGDDDVVSYNRAVTVDNSGKRDMPAIKSLQTGADFKTDDFGGATIGADGSASSVIILDPIKDVTRSDFFTTGNITYVTIKGTTYEVSDQVECYNSDLKAWFSGSDPLGEVRAYSNDLTIYVDPLGQKVRIIASTK